MAQYALSINGAQVKSPQTLECAVQDIDAKADRDSNGLLHRDRVAVKRKLSVKWGPLTVGECKTILTAMSGQFFSCTYLDPQEGALSTRTFYAGDRTMPVYTFNEQLSTYVWQNLSVDFIEQ
ncbi:DUF6711 family protein [Oenococcus oeni]|uniref:Prophage protein n=2 Tax=root TaxID=1 RepID=V5UQS8_9CAUD|nr:DUF6711 family protein [Oenococcus oeni]YP_009006582.1 hypothetical protein CF81_gp20 [Oenococcus phage phiS11]AHB80341.1 hypothetical protein [Oenococcus phage phiS11]KGH52417.1 hypothetical protein X325_06770 [Oenococcus oeni S11]MDS0175959.1 hypothetical protein [Oenococcus oeni]MDV7715288.1 hypothetical protein [Oenococcus oeni]OIM37126.1 hypothetical protein ATX68_12905 [Oenococcus oeni]